MNYEMTPEKREKILREVREREAFYMLLISQFKRKDFDIEYNDDNTVKSLLELKKILHLGYDDEEE